METSNGKSERPGSWGWNRRCVRVGDNASNQSKTPDPFELLSKRDVLMADVFENRYFSNVESFMLAASRASLLSACGGPYPDRADVEVILSRQRAIDLIADATLDAVPHHELDRVLVEGRLAARAMFGRTWIQSLVDGGMPNEEKELEKSMKKVVSGVPRQVFQRPSELSIVQAHLVGLFTTTSLLIRAGKLFCFRNVALATDLAMAGYLPVDLALRGKNRNEDCVLIY